MARVRAKICCISSIEEARLAVAAGTDALGLVAKMPSGPGPISDDLISRIADTVPPPVSCFLLTSETEPDAVVAHVKRCGTDTVQLVDAVPLHTYKALRSDCPNVRIVQVIHVEDEAAIDEAKTLAPHVDALLLDSGRPKASARDGSVKELGGTGRTHDWSVSAKLVAEVEKPVFLAGGLNAFNVGEAIRAVRPFGVDLCSGVRTDGALDAEKLREYLEVVGRRES